MFYLFSVYTKQKKAPLERSLKMQNYLMPKPPLNCKAEYDDGYGG